MVFLWHISYWLPFNWKQEWPPVGAFCWYGSLFDNHLRGCFFEEYLDYLDQDISMWYFLHFYFLNSQDEVAKPGIFSAFELQFSTHLNLVHIFCFMTCTCKFSDSVSEIWCQIFYSKPDLSERCFDVLNLLYKTEDLKQD